MRTARSVRAATFRSPRTTSCGSSTSSSRGGSRRSARSLPGRLQPRGQRARPRSLRPSSGPADRVRDREPVVRARPRSTSCGGRWTTGSWASSCTRPGRASSSSTRSRTRCWTSPARRGCPSTSVPARPRTRCRLQLTEVARRHPDVRFVMGHMGHSDFWIDAIPAAAGAPNIYRRHLLHAAARDQRGGRDARPERVVYSSDAPFNEMRLELEKLLGAGLDERATRARRRRNPPLLAPPGTLA